MPRKKIAIYSKKKKSLMKLKGSTEVTSSSRRSRSAAQNPESESNEIETPRDEDADTACTVDKPLLSSEGEQLKERSKLKTFRDNAKGKMVLDKVNNDPIKVIIPVTNAEEKPNIVEMVAQKTLTRKLKNIRGNISAKMRESSTIKQPRKTHLPDKEVSLQSENSNENEKPETENEITHNLTLEKCPKSKTRNKSSTVAELDNIANNVTTSDVTVENTRVEVGNEFAVKVETRKENHIQEASESNAKASISKPQKGKDNVKSEITDTSSESTDCNSVVSQCASLCESLRKDKPKGKTLRKSTKNKARVVITTSPGVRKTRTSHMSDIHSDTPNITSPRENRIKPVKEVSNSDLKIGTNVKTCDSGQIATICDEPHATESERSTTDNTVRVVDIEPDIEMQLKDKDSLSVKSNTAIDYQESDPDTTSDNHDTGDNVRDQANIISIQEEVDEASTHLQTDTSMENNVESVETNVDAQKNNLITSNSHPNIASDDVSDKKNDTKTTAVADCVSQVQTSGTKIENITTVSIPVDEKQSLHSVSATVKHLNNTTANPITTVVEVSIGPGKTTGKNCVDVCPQEDIVKKQSCISNAVNKKKSIESPTCKALPQNDFKTIPTMDNEIKQLLQGTLSKSLSNVDQASAYTKFHPNLVLLQQHVSQMKNLNNYTRNKETLFRHFLMNLYQILQKLAKLLEGKLDYFNCFQQDLIRILKNRSTSILNNRNASLNKYKNTQFQQCITSLVNTVELFFQMNRLSPAASINAFNVSSQPFAPSAPARPNSNTPRQQHQTFSQPIPTYLRPPPSVNRPEMFNRPPPFPNYRCLPPTNQPLPSFPDPPPQFPNFLSAPPVVPSQPMGPFVRHNHPPPSTIQQLQYPYPPPKITAVYFQNVPPPLNQNIINQSIVPPPGVRPYILPPVADTIQPFPPKVETHNHETTAQSYTENSELDYFLGITCRREYQTHAKPEDMAFEERKQLPRSRSNNSERYERKSDSNSRKRKHSDRGSRDSDSYTRDLYSPLSADIRRSRSLSPFESRTGGRMHRYKDYSPISISDGDEVSQTEGRHGAGKYRSRTPYSCSPVSSVDDRPTSHYHNRRFSPVSDDDTRFEMKQVDELEEKHFPRRKHADRYSPVSVDKDEITGGKKDEAAWSLFDRLRAYQEKDQVNLPDDKRDSKRRPRSSTSRRSPPLNRSVSREMSPAHGMEQVTPMNKYDSMTVSSDISRSKRANRPKSRSRSRIRSGRYSPDNTRSRSHSPGVSRKCYRSPSWSKDYHKIHPYRRQRSRESYDNVSSSEDEQTIKSGLYIRERHSVRSHKYNYSVQAESDERYRHHNQRMNKFDQTEVDIDTRYTDDRYRGRRSFHTSDHSHESGRHPDHESVSSGSIISVEKTGDYESHKRKIKTESELNDNQSGLTKYDLVKHILTGQNVADIYQSCAKNPDVMQGPKMGYAQSYLAGKYNDIPEYTPVDEVKIKQSKSEHRDYY